LTSGQGAKSLTQEKMIVWSPLVVGNGH